MAKIISRLVKQRAALTPTSRGASELTVSRTFGIIWSSLLLLLPTSDCSSACDS